MSKLTNACDIIINEYHKNINKVYEYTNIKSYEDIKDNDIKKVIDNIKDKTNSLVLLKENTYIPDIISEVIKDMTNRINELENKISNNDYDKNAIKFTQSNIRNIKNSLSVLKSYVNKRKLLNQIKHSIENDKD